MSDPYQYMDDMLTPVRRGMVKGFGDIRSGSYKSSEGKILRLVRKIYNEIKERADRMLLKVVRHYYKKAGGKKKKYDDDWLLDFLLEFDPITGYQYDPEWDRKMYRTFEETVASRNINRTPEKSLKTAMGLLNKQITQKAIEAADQGTIDGYKENGYKYIRWNAILDERTCADCEERNGKIFRIDNIPEKHYYCRCWFTPVKDPKNEDNKRNDRGD